MHPLLRYLNSLKKEEQADYAARCKTTVGYLRKACSMGQLIREIVCSRLEQESGGAVTRKALRPNDWQTIWPELAKPQAEPAPIAIETVADAHAAIKHVEAVAVAAIRQGAGQATAEIKHVAEELLKDDAPWDGETDRRQADAPWDGKTERRKLDAPIDRRVSPESVARAEFFRRQRGV